MVCRIRVLTLASSHTQIKECADKVELAGGKKGEGGSGGGGQKKEKPAAKPPPVEEPPAKPAGPPKKAPATKVSINRREFEWSCKTF